jgi:hypothetical protein
LTTPVSALAARTKGADTAVAAEYLRNSRLRMNFSSLEWMDVGPEFASRRYWHRVQPTSGASAIADFPDQFKILHWPGVCTSAISVICRW